MYTDPTRQPVSTDSPAFDTFAPVTPDHTLAHERAVEEILDDCFLSIGQGIGVRASLEFDAILYVRKTLRSKFLAAMRACGNRWLEDRTTVTAVGWMLGERAVRYADGAPTIGVDAVRKATADVERYCQLHAARRSGVRGGTPIEASVARIAGYWCTWEPRE
jgi:hypothetical protein